MTEVINPSTQAEKEPLLNNIGKEECIKKTEDPLVPSVLPWIRSVGNYNNPIQGQLLLAQTPQE